MRKLFYIAIYFMFMISADAHELDRYVRVFESPTPSYPSVDPSSSFVLAGGEKADGIVSVIFKVDAKGDAKIERIMNSSSWRFSEAARIAAEKWKFAPGKRDGFPSGGLIEFVFFFAPDKEVKVIGPLYER